VIFNGSPPAPLVAGATYYVQSVASGGSVITLAATSGGAVIPLTNSYTGTSYIFGGTASGLTVRCRIDKLNGRKGELARQYMPTATHIVEMRYRSTVNENTSRLVFKQGRIYNIGVVDDVDKMHVRLELTCEELVPKGAA
jgi:SPP1 family predicted phage head-tail adaptor